MPNHMIGIGGLPQRAALVALLPAARLARAASQAARDPRLCSSWQREQFVVET